MTGSFHQGGFVMITKFANKLSVEKLYHYWKGLDLISNWLWLVPSWFRRSRKVYHYTDVTMTTMASQITSLTVVYPTVFADADQRKHQSSASLAFVPRTKGQLRGKCFHLMTSSCVAVCLWNQRNEAWWSVSNLGQHWLKLVVCSA